MTDHLRSGTAWCTGIGTVVLILLYVGSYYLLVRPAGVPVRLIEVEKAPSFPALESVASPGDVTFWTRVYGPIHWADRRIRTTIWATESRW